MTYRLQYSTAEHEAVLANALVTWAREDQDLHLVSSEGHKLYTSQRLFSLMSPSLSPILLSSSTPVISLPYTAATLASLLSLLATGSSSASNTSSKEVEDAASCLGIPLFCIVQGNGKRPAPARIMRLGNLGKKSGAVPPKPSSFVSSPSLSIIPVKQESKALVEEERDQTLEEVAFPSEERVNCQLCPASFGRKNHLKRHIIKKHPDAAVKNSSPDSSEALKCDQCEMTFTTAVKLAKHERSHAAGGLFNCLTCDKGFESDKKLKKHEQTHTGTGEYQCEECLKCFKSSSSLILHRNIHLPEMPFKCDQCEKGFAQKGNLKAHVIRYHADGIMDTTDVEAIQVIGEAETIEAVEVGDDEFEKLSEQIEVD